MLTAPGADCARIDAYENKVRASAEGGCVLRIGPGRSIGHTHVKSHADRYVSFLLGMQDCSARIARGLFCGRSALGTSLSSGKMRRTHEVQSAKIGAANANAVGLFLFPERVNIGVSFETPMFFAG